MIIPLFLYETYYGLLCSVYGGQAGRGGYH